MYNKIVVPLDGSPAAECVIDHVRSVAASGTEVILVRIVAKPNMDFLVKEPELCACLEDELSKEAAEYLSSVAARLAMPGVTVSTCVVADQGPVGSIVVELTRKCGADLVVISAHGKTGIAGSLIGSVADKIVHHAHVPVLIAHP
jgi:nucleotide-binding universal stress UspA family protein